MCCDEDREYGLERTLDMIFGGTSNTAQHVDKQREDARSDEVVVSFSYGNVYYAVISKTRIFRESDLFVCKVIV